MNRPAGFHRDHSLRQISFNRYFRLVRKARRLRHTLSRFFVQSVALLC